MTYVRFCDKKKLLYVKCQKLQKDKSSSFSCANRMLRRINQSSLNTSTYIGISSHKVWMCTSLLFLRSRGDKSLSYGTGNRRIEWLNENES